MSLVKVLSTNAKVVNSLLKVTTSAIIQWILQFGFWSDQGRWIDNSNWVD